MNSLWGGLSAIQAHASQALQDVKAGVVQAHADLLAEQARHSSEVDRECNNRKKLPWDAISCAGATPVEVERARSYCREQVLKLSSSDRTFLEPPPADVGFQFPETLDSDDVIVAQAELLLAEDERLEAARFRLVRPRAMVAQTTENNAVAAKTTEHLFWKSYFYRVSLVVELSNLSLRDGRDGRAEEVMKSRCDDDKGKGEWSTTGATSPSPSALSPPNVPQSHAGWSSSRNRMPPPHDMVAAPLTATGSTSAFSASTTKEEVEGRGDDARSASTTEAQNSTGGARSSHLRQTAATSGDSASVASSTASWEMLSAGRSSPGSLTFSLTRDRDRDSLRGPSSPVSELSCRTGEGEFLDTDTINQSNDNEPPSSAPNASSVRDGAIAGLGADTIDGELLDGLEDLGLEELMADAKLGDDSDDGIMAPFGKESDDAVAIEELKKELGLSDL